jgi:hypothetical protein
VPSFLTDGEGDVNTESLSESPGKDLPGHAIPPVPVTTAYREAVRYPLSGSAFTLTTPAVHLFGRIYVKSAVFTTKQHGW